MKTVNVHQAKTHFSKLLAQVETKRDRIVICRNGQPVADLTPHERKNRIQPHPLLRKIKLKYDPVESLGLDEWPRESR